MRTIFPRRWLRFSVRTLVIVVTILCVWLAWTVYVVRERTTLIRISAADNAVVKDKD